MNKKVITVIVVLVIVALCGMAVIYAPSIMESILRLHSIPQH